jgi:uncharacterized protein (DUF2141 family)
MIRSFYPIFILLVLVPFRLFAQFSLTIEIKELRNNNGQINLELSNQHEEQIAGITKKLSSNSCVIVIDNLKPGKYAFKFFHDENMNNELDTNWLGIPKEGFGFSNDPSMTFGPPSFDKTIFYLNKSIVIACKPKYL